MSFTGGRLKLKGQDGGVKKRKKKKSSEGAEAEKALVVIDIGDNGPSTAVGKVCMLLATHVDPHPSWTGIAVSCGFLL